MNGELEPLNLPAPRSDAPCSQRSRGPSAGLIVYIHGYLDDCRVWDRVTEHPAFADWHQRAIDLRQTGIPVGEAVRGRVLEAYRDQVAAFLVEDSAGAEGPVIVVGHSMGGQVAELVAAQLADLVAGLVLIVPAPLQGSPLTPVQMRSFEERIGIQDAEEIAAGKHRLARSLDEAGAGTLVDATLKTSPEAAREALVAWTGGHPSGETSSAYAGATLVMASDDQFFSEAFLSREVVPRFADVTTAYIPGAGHWPQVERPAAVASALDDYLTRITRQDEPSFITSGKWRHV